MIAKTFREPNFKCRVSDQDGSNVRDIILYGKDDNFIRARLERKRRLKMLAIEPYDFSSWKNEARKKAEAAAAAIGGGGRYDFDANNLWSRLKDHLFDLFDEKCAYCEITMLGAYYGDVEHYRPKSAVKENQGHKGYYWLAYDPENYLPSCNRCNNSKSSHFPVADESKRAQKPGDDIEKERPLYINPYHFEPGRHLTFRFRADDERIGAVAVGLTDEGKKTIEDLGLNRGDLLAERSREQDNALCDYAMTRKLRLHPNPVIEALKSGDRPFCAASLAYIQAVITVAPDD